MRSLRIESFGAAPRLVEGELPPPGPGEVRIAVRACALNFADLLMIEGTYQNTPDPPFTPGLEMAGTVEALGPDTQGPPPGSRVAVYAGRGGLAEAANVPADLLTPVPDGVEWDVAAAAQIAHGTAHLALSRRARLHPGERLVVTGAAGGAGLSAVAIGALMGAEVVAIARGADRLEVARAAGATHLIDAEATDLREQVRALGGADVVYDTVGGEMWRALFRATNPEGRLLPVGFAGGEVPQVPANHLMVKNLSVIGVNWGGYLRFAPDALRESVGVVMGWLAEGRLSVHIGARYPLARAADALEDLRARRTTGKIVVTMP